MDSPAAPLVAVARLNTDLLPNALADVSEDEARQRPGGVNPIAFLAAHVLDARHFLAGMLGPPLPNPIGEALADARSADDVTDLPNLADVRREWRAVSAQLEARLAAASPADLAAPSPQAFPVDDPSLGAGIGFLLQHESYHLGQIALLRRQLGHGPMRYDRRTS